MKIPCIIDESINRPEAVRWRERMSLLQPIGDVVVVLPCSMRKPYSSSKSHTIFMRATKNIQEAILTSPFGVCPRELERTYPIQSYDTSTTGDWSKEEISLTGECLKKYVNGKDVIAHVSGGYREVCESYLDNAIYTCNDGRVTSWDSMDNLKMEVKKYPRLKTHDKRINGFRSIARYQFRTRKADSLIPDGTKAVGRFMKRMIHEKEQIATLSFDTGLYSLNLKGGEALQDIGVNWVEIDFDMKTNTLFAPGVVDADPDIIPKDEVVIIRNDEVVAIGKAVLCGEEMKSANKGIAVKIRHRKK
jgi:archaeosine synthase alpha-subunit